MTPRLTVVIRSYNRLPSLVELLEILLAQAHDAFEIVVVDQSTERPEAATRRLAELGADPRLRFMRYAPLGGARARNIGVAAARGAVVVLLDDDDLPIGTDWLTKLELPFSDPACLGVTCRHLWREDDRPSALYRVFARRRCMRFSPVLKTPSTYCRLDEPVRPVDYVHGTGGAIRRSAFERFGGWDNDTPIEDELSFSLRVAAGKRDDEYFAFVPEPCLQRGLDVGGGLGKRLLSSGAFFGKFMTFVHRILGRYRPWRVRLLYPLYVVAGAVFVIDWIWNDSRRYQTALGRLGGSATFLLLLPLHAARMVRQPFGRIEDAALPGAEHHAQPLSEQAA
ncbi:MAG: glycosyl transferase family 2 [Deltaproteobacteria bacterium]|nr:glycosyl transferase family 2 [Deltaproteobacteria bacterium]